MYISIGYVLVKIIISLKARESPTCVTVFNEQPKRNYAFNAFDFTEMSGPNKRERAKKKKKTKAIKNLLMTFLFRGVLALSLSLIPVLLPHGDNYAILLPGPVSFDPM